jgi:hypothetical protein
LPSFLLSLAPLHRSRTVRAHPRTVRMILHHVLPVFSRILSSFAWISSSKMVRVWCCDLKSDHGFEWLIGGIGC